MAVCRGIDLHSNNAVLALIDGAGGALSQQRGWRSTSYV